MLRVKTVPQYIFLCAEIGRIKFGQENHVIVFFYLSIFGQMSCNTRKGSLIPWEIVHVLQVYSKICETQSIIPRIIN